MNIIVNSESMAVDTGTSVSALLDSMNANIPGVAVAVNNKIVKKDEWHSHLLQENDRVVVIKAACGG